MEINRDKQLVLFEKVEVVKIFSRVVIPLFLSKKVQAPNEYTRVQAAEIEEPAEDVEIEFWTYNDGWKAPINHFQLIHPKIKNKKALAFFDSAYYSQFTTGEYLEDLLKEPYYAGRYEKDFGNDFPDITRCDFLPGGCNGGKR